MRSETHECDPSANLGNVNATSPMRTQNPTSSYPWDLPLRDHDTMDTNTINISSEAPQTRQIPHEYNEQIFRHKSALRKGGILFVTAMKNIRHQPSTIQNMRKWLVANLKHTQAPGSPTKCTNQLQSIIWTYYVPQIMQNNIKTMNSPQFLHDELINF